MGRPPSTARLVKAILATGRPERLNVRKCPVFGIVIEGPDCLPIGGPFATLEAAHAAHSRAWFKAWES